MNTITRLLAPKSAMGFTIRYLFLVIAINLFDTLVNFAISGDVLTNLGLNLSVTTCVSTPFIILALTLFNSLYELQEKLAHLASTDMLTGLPNRRAFFTRAGGSIDGRRDVPEPGMLILFDVDHFKKVNDTFGHAAGDICLQAVGARLREAAREIDHVARVGGEEFALFITGGNHELAFEVSEMLTEGLTVVTEEDGTELVITLSAGAVASTPGLGLNELMRLADEALYRAKAAGRACMVMAENGALNG